MRVRFPRRAREEKPSPADTEEGLKLYPHEYVGHDSAFGLTRGPCVIERPWASGYIIRDVHGRRWTVARKDVRKRKP